MKVSRLWVVIALVCLCSSLLAMDLMDATSKHKPKDPKGTSAKKSTVQSATSARGGATLQNGTAYVRVSTALNIRKGAWGEIVGTFSNNAKVTITGRDGDWYQISHNGETKYIHSRYVSGAKGSAPVVASTGASVTSGSQQQRIVQASRNVVAKYKGYKSFPYAPATQGGNLGCAQVVTHTLRQAGINVPIILGVDNTATALGKIGWKRTRVPPYRQGDVIIWNPSHIGIIQQNGNNVQAMSNSSSRRSPRVHRHDYMNIRYVLRKA